MKIDNRSRWLAALALAGACASAAADDIYVTYGTDTGGRYLPGMDVRYQLSIQTRGTQLARNVRVIDVFPSQCTQVAWTCDDSQQPGSCTTRSGTGSIDTVVDVRPDVSLSFEAYCRLADPLPARRRT